MFWKKFIKDYFNFSRRDRIGILTITVLIAIIYFLPWFFINKNEPFPLKQGSVLAKAIDTLKVRQANFYNKNDHVTDYTYQYEPSETGSFKNGEVFHFDPNTISIQDWQRLGLNEKVIKTINNYKNKGGKFYKPEDLKKIWGMPHGFYTRVKDYISINLDQKQEHATIYTRSTYKKKEKENTILNINAADTYSFINLPGIGSKLAARIVSFRDKLGGYYSVDQIKETYGLPDSTFQKIKSYLYVNETDIRKININTASKEDLKIHPYIRWNLANAIVEYRNQHGKYENLQSIKNIVLITEDVFTKLVPYLTVE